MKMVVMRRRVLLAGAAASLAGCGFQLRQAPHFAFSTLYISAPSTSPLAVELRRNLESQGQVHTTFDATQAMQSDAIFDLLSEQVERAVVGLNAAGQVRELQLRLRVRFRLRTPAGKEVLAPTELLQTSDISYSESAALAKEAEEALLQRNMRTDIVQQIIRRLAAVQAL